MINKNKETRPTPKLFNFYQDSSLARMINFINEAVIVIDSSGVIEMLNPMVANLMGAQRDRLLGHNLLELVVDAKGKSQTLLIDCLEKGRHYPISSPPIELNLKADLSPTISVEMSISTLPEELSSSNTLFLCILRDLTLHKAEYGLLKQKANTDYLTGLANRHRLPTT